METPTTGGDDRDAAVAATIQSVECICLTDRICRFKNETKNASPVRNRYSSKPNIPRKGHESVCDENVRRKCTPARVILGNFFLKNRTCIHEHSDASLSLPDLSGFKGSAVTLDPRTEKCPPALYTPLKNFVVTEGPPLRRITGRAQRPAGQRRDDESWIKSGHECKLDRRLCHLAASAGMCALRDTSS